MYLLSQCQILTKSIIAVSWNWIYQRLRWGIVRTNKKSIISNIFFQIQNGVKNCLFHFLLKFRIDGMCRHVVTTLFEVINYIDDKNKDSVTSVPCIWVRKSTKTSHWVGNTVNSHNFGTKTIGRNIHVITTWRSLAKSWLTNVPCKGNPTLRMYTRCIRAKAATHNPNTSKLTDVSLPCEKTQHFWTVNNIMPFHMCTDICYAEFADYLQFTSDEIVKTETGTKVKAESPIWKLSRNEIITSSSFKTVCHSTDLNRTATTLISGSSLNESNLPEPIVFGRKFEKRARELFIRSHRYHHRKCQITDYKYGVPYFMNMMLICCKYIIFLLLLSFWMPYMFKINISFTLYFRMF